MHAYRLRAPHVYRPAVALHVGIVSAALALTTAPTATATTQPPAGETIQPGERYAGVGARAEPGLGPETTRDESVPADTSGVQGIDVSHALGTIDWEAVKASGISFVHMKATEGASFKDPRFDENYADASDAGLIRGAYHFARPDASSGSAQADHFVSNGGAWAPDDQTLPGVLGLEHNPSGAMCYGLSPAQTRDWISDFHAAYKTHTSRDIVIYTTSSWWDTCTDSWSGMSTKAPLWVADWEASSPTIPTGFSTWAFWQYEATGRVDGISGEVGLNKFNGSASQLLALANNTY